MTDIALVRLLEERDILIERLHAEIERLTAALLQIANLNGVSTRLDAQKVANRALEPKP